jgi:hypothetical protein
MSYKLRFVQKFQPGNSIEFLEIEKQFAGFEEKYPEFPKGKRYLPLTGMHPSNTLIWECDFDTLEELQKAHQFLMGDNRHEELFRKQAQYMIDTYTEIYRPYDS